LRDDDGGHLSPIVLGKSDHPGGAVSERASREDSKRLPEVDRFDNLGHVVAPPAEGEFSVGRGRNGSGI
jgi:hypothetical protein